ncbi:MAG: prepilin-type N-terminal cleavage/methylation domain-containing protein [Gemmatimonadaceae bacterium]
MQRQALTLLEVLLVVSLAGILAALALPPYVALRDRASVRAAVTASVAAFDAARALALTRGRHAAVRIDTAGARIVVHSFQDTLLLVSLGTAWGVSVSASRDSSAVAPDGLGYGAANLRLILARGAAADTITVSRLGRVARR